MPRGRKPLPAALKRLRARDHNKQRPGKIPVTPIGAPSDIPPLIAHDPDALYAWNRFQKDFVQMKVLSPKDWSALTTLCLAWAQLCKTKKSIDQHGYVIQRKKRGLVANPAVSQYNKAMNTIVRTSAEFGLTPASVMRVREIPESDEENAQLQGKQSAEQFLFNNGTTGKVISINKRRK